MTDTTQGAAGADTSTASAAAGSAAADQTATSAAAAAGGAAASGSGEPGAAGQASGTGADPSPVYRPEGLPDHLVGKDERETIDKLHKAYAGAREAIGKFGPVPEKPEAYAFTPPEAIAPYIPDPGNDPVLKTFQTVAHRHGLGEKQFQGVVSDMFAELIGNGALDDPFDPAKERAIIAPGLAGDEQKVAAAKASSDAIAYVDALVAQKALPPETADFVKGRMDRGHMIAFVNVMRAQGGQTVALGGQIGSSGITMADLRARQADPRHTHGNPAYSEAFVKETDRLYQLLVPEKAEQRA